MNQDVVRPNAVRIDDRVLELAPLLPGCAGFVLLRLAAGPQERVSRLHLMEYVGRSEAPVRLAITELSKRKLCTVDAQGCVMFTPEGLDG